MKGKGILIGIISGVLIICAALAIAVALNVIKIDWKSNPAVEENKIDAEVAIGLYRDFCVENVDDLVDGASLIDLDYNGIPELILYLRSGPVSNMAEVYTVEAGKVCALTDIRSSVAAPQSKGAIGAALFASPYPEQSTAIDNCFSFYEYIDKDGDSAYYLCSITGNDSFGEGIWYRFGSKDGALSADVLFEYGTYEDWYIGDDDKAGKSFVNGAQVTNEAFSEANIEWRQKFSSDYKLLSPEKTAEATQLRPLNDIDWINKLFDSFGTIT